MVKLKKLLTFTFFPLFLNACGGYSPTKPMPKECKEALEAYKIMLETKYVGHRSEIKEYIKDLERGFSQEIAKGNDYDMVPDCIGVKEEVEELIQEYRQEMTGK